MKGSTRLYLTICFIAAWFFVDAYRAEIIEIIWSITYKGWVAVGLIVIVIDAFIFCPRVTAYENKIERGIDHPSEITFWFLHPFAWCCVVFLFFWHVATTIHKWADENI